MADLMAACQPYGVKVEGVRDVVDQKCLALLASVAQLELDALRERTAMGKRGRAKQGRVPVGHLPFGYVVGEDGRPETHEYRASVVRRVYAMALDGLGMRRIADRLNGEGIAAPAGGRWLPGSVQRLLADAAYTGSWSFGKRKVRTTEAGRVVRRTSESEQVGVPVPVLVDRQMWEQVQRLKLQRRKGSGGRRRHFYLLSGSAKCSECGLNLTGLARAGGRLKYYACNGATLYGLRCRPKPYIRADRLERIVWGEVADSLADPDSFVDTLLSMNDTDSASAPAEEIGRAEVDLRKITAEEDRIIRLYAMDKLTETQLDRQRRFITERREAAEERLAGLRAQFQTVQDRDIGLDSVREWVGRIGDRLADLDDEGRREVLRLVLEDVIVGGDDTLRLNFVLPVDEPFSVATRTTASACRGSGPPPAA